MSQHTVILATALDMYWARIELQLQYKGKIPIWPDTQAVQSLMHTTRCCQHTELCEPAWHHHIRRQRVNMPLTCSYTVVSQLPFLPQTPEKKSVCEEGCWGNRERDRSFWNITWPWHHFRAHCQTHILTSPPVPWFSSFFSPLSQSNQSHDV